MKTLKIVLVSLFAITCQYLSAQKVTVCATVKHPETFKILDFVCDAMNVEEVEAQLTEISLKHRVTKLYVEVPISPTKSKVCLFELGSKALKVQEHSF